MDDFLSWWQHLPATIDPVIFQIGSFRLQYYGLMYIVAFGITWALVSYRINREDRFAITQEQVQDICLYIIVGLLVGARLGYVFFYNFSYYLNHPLEIILPFQFADGFRFTGISGMSFHGGLIGIIIAGWYCCKKSGLSILDAFDLFIPAIPLGYTFGRLGNFINGELYGRVTDAAIGMSFPYAPDPRLRHPSQLYEAFFEGIVLFAVLWPLRRARLPRGAMLGLYLIGYGSVRFAIEFFRQPDAHIGFVLFRLSMGQLLCGTMIAAGAGYLAWVYRRSGAGR
jgi:phosphatidylglycerol---prolipoprotein diacylglyceryl transferase